MADPSRVYQFDAIFNFRDFGNYATRDGAHIRPGQLFRAANFHRASDSDLNRLSDLGIKLRVDLRHAAERERQPNKWPGDGATTFVNFEKDGDHAEDLAPHEMFVKEQLYRPEDARAYMQASYAARPDDPNFRAIFSKTLKHMASDGGPFVIHCAAGKDRTGTLAAIILSALNVDPETIMSDYMLTMSAVDIEAFLEPASKMMGKRYERTFSPDALRPMFGVERSYLENSLTAIGDMDRYISDALGISDTERQAIMDNYLS